MSFTDVFKKIFGTKADRDMKAIKPTLDKVLAAYDKIDKLSDDELREHCQVLNIGSDHTEVYIVTQRAANSNTN